MGRRRSQRRFRRGLKYIQHGWKRALFLIVITFLVAQMAAFLVGSDKLHQSMAQSLARSLAYEITGANMPIAITGGNIWGFEFQIPYSKYAKGEETRRGVVEGTYTSGPKPKIEVTTREEYNRHHDSGKRNVYTHNGRVEIHAE